MLTAPRVLPAGDRVLIAEYGDSIDEAVNVRVHQVARAIDRAGALGVVETVPTYRSVAVHFDPLQTSADAVVDLLREIDARAGLEPAPAPRVVDIPVVYGGDGGPDLADVAAHCGLTEAEVVSIHAAGAYRVYMMGFTPGFPYLGGMSPKIAVPRLATPRTAVPAGPVGIAAQQTGIYPTTSPGGWRLIGRTCVRLFDPHAEPPALVDAGDLIRFVPVAASEQPSGGVAAGPEAIPVADAFGIDVLEGGLLTTVQDLGRNGFQRFGVPVSGAMDTFALRAGNRLVGNADGEAALEVTLVGPVLRFDVDTLVAATGADLRPRLNGRPMRMGRTVRVRRGDVLAYAGPDCGIRSYLAVAGGIAVPQVLGSRSTYLASGFGGFFGRALRAGDRLPVAPGTRAGLEVRRSTSDPRGDLRGSDQAVRVVWGPQDGAFTDRGRESFLAGTYTLSARSDRVGCRFEGPSVEHRAGADIVSDGTAFGAVQISGDGLPIVLMADRGTTGGYTKIATVISADLPILAQAAPGTSVRFRAVDRETALAALLEREAWLAGLTRVNSDTGDDIFDEDRGSELAADGAEVFAAALDVRRSSPVDVQPGVRAGMTGVVAAVLVEAGASVVPREVLLVIEAMKMQNPVRAPKAGRVARVHVSPGMPVSAGTVVVDYED